MPIQFRKTITIFPGVRLNFSKSGVSLSIGKKGAFSLNFSKRGVRQTTDLPGEGLYHTSYLFKNRDDDKESKNEVRTSDQADEKPGRRTRRSVQEQIPFPWNFLLFVTIALFFFYFGAEALGLLPPNLVTNFLQTLTQWVQRAGL